MAAPLGTRLAARASRYLGWVLGPSFVQGWLKRRIRAGPPSPTDEERAQGKTFLWGEATDDAGLRVAALGLHVYPEAVTLAAQTGTRQILVDLAQQLDLSAGSTGTRYFVSNSRVIQVSADGMISALQPGVATVTVINGPAEKLIHVKVQVPQVGPVTMGADGGVVQGSDGSIVAVPQGVLAAGTTVSIAPVAQASLPMALPGGVQFRGAFSLGLGANKLAVPIQLAAPAPGIVPGTKVLFYRAAQLPDESGTLIPIWLEDEFGVVGNDGFARTSSFPAPGLTLTGTYMFGIAPDTGSVRGHITFPVGVADGGSSFFILSSLGGGVGVGAAIGLTFGFVFDLFLGDNPKLEEIPRAGPPVIQNIQLHVQTTGLNDYFASVQTLPPGIDPPFITDSNLQVNPDGTNQLTLTGTDFGQSTDNITVHFQIGGKDDNGVQHGGKDYDVTGLHPSGDMVILAVHTLRSLPCASAIRRFPRPLQRSGSGKFLGENSMDEHTCWNIRPFTAHLD
jgi:hypothetical protein